MSRLRGRALPLLVAVALALVAGVAGLAVAVTHQRGVVRGAEVTWTTTALPGARLVGFDAGRLLLSEGSGLVVYDRPSGQVRQRVEVARTGAGQGAAGPTGALLAPGGVLHTGDGTLVFAAESGAGWRLPGRSDRTYLLGLDSRARVAAALRCQGGSCRALGVDLRDGAVRWSRPAALAIPYFSRGTGDPQPVFGVITAIGRPPFVPFGPENTYQVLDVATGAVRAEVVSGSAYLAGEAVLFTGRGECGLVVAAASVREPRWPAGRPAACRVLGLRAGTAYVGDAGGLLAVDLAGGGVRRLPDGLGSPADTIARVDAASASLYPRARRGGSVEVLDVRSGRVVARYPVGTRGRLALGDGTALLEGVPTRWQRRFGGAPAGGTLLTVYRSGRPGGRLVLRGPAAGRYPLDHGQALVVGVGRLYLLSA